MTPALRDLARYHARHAHTAEQRQAARDLLPPDEQAMLDDDAGRDNYGGTVVVLMLAILAGATLCAVATHFGWIG